MLLAGKIAVALQSDLRSTDFYDPVQDESVSSSGERNPRETDIAHPDLFGGSQEDRVAPPFNEGTHAAACGCEEHFPALAEEGGYLGNEYFVGYKVRHCVGFDGFRFRLVYV